MKHRRSVIVAATLALVLTGACGSSESPGKTPKGARASCAADADCEVTNFAGCCACCQSDAHALPAIELTRQRGQCAIKDCEAACSPNIECAKIQEAAAFVARCKDGTCAATRR